MISLKADMNSYKKDANDIRMKGSGEDIIAELTFIFNELYSLNKYTKQFLLITLQAFQKLNGKKSFDDFFKEIEKKGDDDAQS